MYLHQPNGSSYYRTRNVAPSYTAPLAQGLAATVVWTFIGWTLSLAAAFVGLYAIYCFTGIIPDGIIPENILPDILANILSDRAFEAHVIKVAIFGAVLGVVIAFIITAGIVITARAENTATDAATGRTIQTGGPSRKQLRFNRFILFLLWAIPLILVGAGAATGVYWLMANGIIPSQTVTEFVVEDMTDWILYGALAGLVLACVIWVFHALSLENQEIAYYNRFIDVRNALPQGNIIFDQAGYPMEIITPGRTIMMESRVWINDTYSSRFFGDLIPTKLGQLMLTNEALEFYDNNFIRRADRSFILNLHDIAYIRANLFTKDLLTVICKSGRYVFHVPIGTAVIWSNAIRHAMQYGSRSLGPTAPRR